jgi:hypothetical protein
MGIGDEISAGVVCGGKSDAKASETAHALTAQTSNWRGMASNAPRLLKLRLILHTTFAWRKQPASRGDSRRGRQKREPAGLLVRGAAGAFHGFRG